MTDWGWVSTQLSDAKIDKHQADAVVFVLELLGKRSVKDQDAVEALKIAQQLVQGHSIAATEDTEKWGPVIPGEYRIGDTVRVRANAYDGELGVKHNGKRGRVVAARDGFVLVVYEGQIDTDRPLRHRPALLQRLV